MATGEPRRERKVVTVLFCDLVGFTSKAESLDPEDVEAILRPYHTRVRSELERHGGTVEKFIGDAVMALFGAPITHEDDPERAMRAALAIRDFAVEDGLELRVGITTGEALVSLDASPAEGEGMASGDVVNTAARLQSAAPVNGVLADETTYRATRSIVDYEKASPIDAKGKSQPIPVWQAAQVRARPGIDVAHESRSELVGREDELRVLRDALGRTRSARTSQLVTLVGVPGIGKSRLVYELRRIVDADPDLITWRQGRCLAYGDGVTLWALGEIVKAQAGIHEQDPPNEAAEKVRSAVAELLTDSADVSWVESNLLSLVGLGSESQLGGDRRSEAFSAWRLFFEAMAERRPLVLVFEDLHWADESLLDFVDELVEWVTDVPLLVVATARPELLERRAGWGGGKLNATTLAVSPLSAEQTAQLIGRLLDRPVLVAVAQQALLDRAGGNPLYAEQFSELYLERGSTEELPLPETLHGIIAARLDGLAPDEKEILRHAAVIGKVFWVGALGRDDRAAAATLHALERKGFVRRQRRTSVQDQAEVAFAHALVRDVAYGQMARADRAAKHRQVAEWIEGLGRPEDHAEMLAHHWRSALELARAAGGDGADLADRARLALREAGDRAFALNAFASAERYYDEALELWPEGDSERPDLLFRRARALHIAGDERRRAALEEARDAVLEAGDVEAAAETGAFLATVAWYEGRRSDADARIAAARTLVVGRPVSAAKARVLCVSARFQMLAGHNEEALETAREALALTKTLTLDELRAHALTTVGSSKNRLELGSGHTEMEEALALARNVNSPMAGNILNNLAVLVVWEGDFRRSDDLYQEAQGIAERFGDRDTLRFTRANGIHTWWVLGKWDEASEASDRFIAESESSPSYGEGIVRRVRGSIRLARGDAKGAFEDWEWSLAQAREIKDPQRLLPSLADLAVSHALLGHEDKARELAEEALEVARQHVDLAAILNMLAVVARQLGIQDKVREIVQLAPEGPWKDVTLAGAEGDFTRVAEAFSGFGALALEADARLIGGESLIEAGRRLEGEAEIKRALEFYRSVGASFFIRRAEASLAESAYSEPA
jgi:class 3 adenylate cyclase/tetratricopeptide (TPR) repeat protein